MRASDLVKGKTHLLGVKVEQNDQPAAMTPMEQDHGAERMSVRLSEIDVLRLKATTPSQAGLTQDKPAPADKPEQLPVAKMDLACSEEMAKILTEESSAPSPVTQIMSKDREFADEGQIHEDLTGPQDNMQKLYLGAKQYMARIRRQVKAGESFDLEPALIYINNVIASTEDLTSRIYQLTVDYDRDDDFYLSSPVNTMVYGLKVAQRIGYEKANLIEFGLAALLHDVGMFKIPDEILNKEGRLTDDELHLIRRHPEMAVEILSGYRNAYPKMIRAIYEHQERANGQGYPQGLKGDEICDYAKIIGICDSYEAMTHHRPHKKARLQSESIKELIGSRSRLFDAYITKAFLDEISIFPVGSYIQLNNRNIGQVVATNRGNPMKPVIKIICDDKGKKIDPARIIDLRAYPVLNIDKSVFPEEIPAL